ncbi:MAG: transposase [Flavobacteriaceae bacterium]
MSRNPKYSSSFKLSAVEKVLYSKCSIVKVCEELGIEKSILRQWVKVYNLYGSKGLEPRSRNTKYTYSFKLKVIKSIDKNGLSFREASIQFNIPSNSTVRNWYLNYQNNGIKGLKTESRGRRPNIMKNKPIKKPSKKPLTREEELLLENESLKAELALLKKLQALAQLRKKK